MSDFIELDDTSFRATLAETTGGIVLFYKALCPHCKNMEKVLEKFSAKVPEAALMKIDSEQCPEAMSTLGVERVPTLLIIRNGRVGATKTGLMNPKELRALYESV